MEPQDDPEDRIRELERPLADTAHASELGSEIGSEIGSAPSSGYAYPPPPPPGPVPPPLTPSPYSYGYGGPPPGMAPQSSSGNRVWWILAALFVVGVLAVVGIIAAYASHRFSRGNLVVPSSGPGTSRVISPPRAIPRSPAPSSLTPLPPQGAELTVTGLNENQALTCNNNVVTVSGVSNTVVITGHCASVTVSGLNNVITVDATDTIDASGLNNQVTYHSGSPQVSKSGDGNVVQRG